MDIPPEIFFGVIAHGLFTLLHAGADRTIDQLKKLLGQDESLKAILDRGVQQLPPMTELGNGRERKRFEQFFRSPEVETIVRQLYSSKLKPNGEGHLNSIRAEFTASLALFVDVNPERLTTFSDPAFDMLLSACDRVLQTFVERGVLVAHDAKSAFRTRLILDELASIRHNLTLLTGRQKPDIPAIIKFEEEYRREVGERHGKITPPHFDVARQVSIDELYVAPGFLTVFRQKEHQPKPIKLREFLSGLHRCVLLGNPGGGKSTLTAKICADLAMRYSDRLVGGKQLTPVLVALREYGTQKRQHSFSILRYVETAASGLYQTEPPAGAFRYLLLNGRVVVIFDGLDELIEGSYRQQIRDDIESFCRAYPSASVLVTSREVGYEQAPLDQRKFSHFRLAPFDDSQVREYARKWFAQDDDLTPAEQVRKAESFFEESDIVADLRTNPLMLALMCNIYRGENYIPKSRPEVYEKCAIMLFERWDKSRGILVPLPFEAHISEAMKYLAFWIYSNKDLQGGVTRQRLVEKATEYLYPRRFDDQVEARRAACEFIDFCKGRAWVFTDTGMTKDGEPLYQFTHRTFLEYFTASYLVRTNPTPERLLKLLLPHILAREWDVICELAFQIQNKQVEGAGDKLLTSLLSRSKGRQYSNAILFVSRCLGFLIPSPVVLRRVVGDCIRWCIESGMAVQPGPDRWDSKVEVRAEVLQELVGAGVENRKTILDSIEKVVTKYASARHDEAASLVALEIGMHLETFNRRRRRELTSVSIAPGFVKALLDASSQRIKYLAPRNLALAIDAIELGIISMKEFVNWHGAGGLFESRKFIVVPMIRMSLGMFLVRAFLSGERGEISSTMIQRLEEIGDALGEKPVWSQSVVSEVERWGYFAERERTLPMQGPVLSPNALWGIFCLLGVVVEAKVVTAGMVMCGCVPTMLRTVVLTRLEQTAATPIELLLEGENLSKERKTMILQWAKREHDFLAKRARQ